MIRVCIQWNIRCLIITKAALRLAGRKKIYYNRLKYPVVSLFGALQSRGSGFGEHYSVIDPEDFTHNYWSGVKPGTGNYVVGVGIAWNLTSLVRTQQQVAARQFTSKGLENEYELVSQQIKSAANTV